MTRSTQKVVKYLDEAHASEVGLVRVLRSQIAITPRGTYRTALERHLGETRDHARRVEERLGELGHGDSRIQAGIGLAETVFAQGLAIAKTRFDLLRGSGGDEKVLKNAKDAAATEALEIATYTAIERLARDVGDDETARLAASIRGDEERMLTRVLDQIPKLTDAVVGSVGRDEGSDDVAKTGDEPWSGYDEQTVEQIRTALGKADDATVKAVGNYERAHKNRAGVLDAAEREQAGA